MFSIKKGVEILSGFRTPITLRKVLYSNNTLQSDDEYLNYLALGMKVQWAENRLYFPLNNDDLNKIIESEKVSKINIKDLSKEYKQSLAYIVQQISSAQENDIKRIMKIMEKENDGGAKWQ